QDGGGRVHLLGERLDHGEERVGGVALPGAVVAGHGLGLVVERLGDALEHRLDLVVDVRGVLEGLRVGHRLGVVGGGGGAVDGRVDVLPVPAVVVVDRAGIGRGVGDDAAVVAGGEAGGA